MMDREPEQAISFYQIDDYSNFHQKAFIHPVTYENRFRDPQPTTGPDSRIPAEEMEGLYNPGVKVISRKPTEN